VLYGKRDLLEAMPRGRRGDMILSVTFEKTTSTSFPTNSRRHAHIEGAIGLAPQSTT